MSPIKMFVQSIQCLIREPNSPIIPPALLAQTSNQQYDPSQQTRSTAYRPSTLQSTPGPPPLSYSLGPDGPLILQSASHSHRPPSPSTPTDQVQSINVRASQYSISHTLAHSYFTSGPPVPRKPSLDTYTPIVGPQTSRKPFITGISTPRPNP